MYPELELTIFMSKKSKKEIASELGMTYNTLLLKLRGKNDFTLDEAVKLKEILNTPKSIEDLFAFSAA